MGRFLALQHIRCNDTDILIIKGAWQDHFSAKVWHNVENESVPASTTVRAGSIVEYDLPQDRLERALAKGVLAEADAEYHFDLARVFDGTVHGAVNAKSKISAADGLREWGVFTLEQIIANQPVTRPITGEVFPLKRILRTFGSDAQVAMWLRACENIVSQSKAVDSELAVHQSAEKPPHIESVVSTTHEKE